MPEVIYSKAIPASKARIWHYVHDMDNWAPFIMGYQSHVKKDDRNSTWTVKGELGVLARTVTFDVLITEWIEEERVSFTLTGVTERFDGEGSFRIGLEAQPEGADFAGTRRRGGVLRRWFRKLFKRRSDEARARQVARTSAGGDTAFSFALSMQAGGMTGPVVNAMIEPLMAKAADDLAKKLTAEILSNGAGEGVARS
jgi:carbon monoxide dehydrogenase subunit G